MADPPISRRALVVGARGGIGSATVEEMRRIGWQVLGLDRDDVVGEETDLTSTAGAQQAVDRAVRELGGLDVVVHAVGMSGRSLGDGPVPDCTDLAWDTVLSVNLSSAFRVLRAALPVTGPGASLVFVGSVLAGSTDDDFLTAAYATSKGGLRSLVRIAARSAAADGVRINLVEPGLVRTPMAERALTQGSPLAARLPELQPLGGRPCSAEEVAAAIVWLASDASAAVTGTTLPVDRGWSLR